MLREGDHVRVGRLHRIGGITRLGPAMDQLNREGIVEQGYR